MENARAVRDRYEFSDEEAESFASRIEVDATLDKHKDSLVRKTALMIPNLVGKITLDIGTGEGRWARYMISKGAIGVVGIDTSEKMINIAKTRDQSDGLIEFYNANVDALGEKEFDFAVAFFMMNYVKNLQEFIMQISKHLAPDGQFLFANKTIELSGNQIEVPKDYLLPISHKDKYKIYSFPHSVSDYISALRDNGFNIVDYQNNVSSDNFLDDELNSLGSKIHDLIVLCRKN